MGTSLKPNKNLDRFRALNLFEDGEEYVDGFCAQKRISYMSFLLFGPFAIFQFKAYQVVLSNRRLFLARLSSLTNAITNVDAFKYGEIQRATFSRGVMLYKIDLCLKSGQSIHLQSSHVGRRWEGFLFDEEKKKYLLEAMSR